MSGHLAEESLFWFLIAETSFLFENRIKYFQVYNLDTRRIPRLDP